MNKKYEGEKLCASIGSGGSISHHLPYQLYKFHEIDDNTNVRMIVGDLYGSIIDKNADIDHIVIFTDIDMNISRKDMEYIIHYITMEFPNTVFCYQSAPMMKDFPEEPTKEQWSIELQRQAMVLEYLGFRNINTLCGFENSIAYLYLNEAAKPIMEDIFYREIDGSYPA